MRTYSEEADTITKCLNVISRLHPIARTTQSMKISREYGVIWESVEEYMARSEVIQATSFHLSSLNWGGVLNSHR